MGLETGTTEMLRRERARHAKSRLPLKDIRVIDMGGVVAAPFAAALLGDFGAEVIKVENPAAPDALRGWGVLPDGSCPWWLVVGRNKLPVTLNLRTDEGKEALARLVAVSDVLIENFRPGVLDRLGFPAARLLEINPGLIIGRISGYGQTGPYSHRPGFGTIAEGLSGYTYLNAEPDGPPINPPMPLADSVAGVHLALAILVALRGARRGESGGQEIDVSLYEPLLGMIGAVFLEYWLTGQVPQPIGSELSYTAPRNNYRTADGRWVTMSASAQAPFERLMDAIGRPEFKTDPRFSRNAERIKPENRRVLNQAIAEWFAGMTLEEALATCDRLDVTAGIIASMKDIAEHEHIRERGTLTDLPEPGGDRTLRFPNVPVRMSGSPGRIRFAGLPVGAANAVVYGDILGYTPEELAEMARKKVI